MHRIIVKIVWLLLKPFFPIIAPILKHYKYKLVFNAVDHRIGEITVNTLFYAAMLEQNYFDEKPIYIFKESAANRFYLNIIVGNRLKYFAEDEFYHTISWKAKKHGLFREVYPDPEIRNLEILSVSERLNFIKSRFALPRLAERMLLKHEKQGRLIDEKMGIAGSMLIFCFMARDGSYLQSVIDNNASLKKAMNDPDFSYQDFRDSSIENCLQAAEYITQQGGTALRMGAVVNRGLVADNSKIIDYASNFRSEFADIYLTSKSKFILSSGCGYGDSSNLGLGIPTIYHNFFHYVGPYKFDFAEFSKDEVQDYFCSKFLVYPKRYYYPKENRDLTVSEIFSNKIHEFYSQQEFDGYGIQLIENTPEEILAVTKEMNDRIDGTYVVTEEERELRRKMYETIRECGYEVTYYALYSGAFLLKYRALII